MNTDTSSPRLLATDTENELPLTDARRPSLADHEAIDSRADGPRRFVDAGEVVQATDDVTSFHSHATRQDFLVVTGERCGDVALEVHDCSALLRSVGVMCDRFELARKLPVVDGRCEDSLSRIRHALAQHGLAPTEFRSHGDLAESFRFTRAPHGRISS